MTFELTSAAFVDGTIPIRYSCQGENVSPPLAWTGAPTATRSFALIVDDADARGYVHWVVFDLPGGDLGRLQEGSAGSGREAKTAKTTQPGWRGPCPPSGLHHYRFRLLALDVTLDLPATATVEDVRQASEGHILDETTLVATYRRQR